MTDKQILALPRIGGWKKESDASWISICNHLLLNEGCICGFFLDILKEFADRAIAAQEEIDILQAPVVGGDAGYA